MKHYLALTFALALTACMNEENPVISGADPQPGQIQLVAMKGLSKVSASSTPGSSNTYTFDLDTANSSIQQYFLLQNTGDCDVKHIKLTTNNPHFYFSPSEIDLLPPAKTASLLQLIKLYVVHGNRLNGVGPDSLLPMGINTARASLIGTTANAHHDSIGISQTADFKVFAKVLDFKFFGRDTVPLDMSHSGYTFSTALGSISSMGVRHFYADSDTLRIANDGNSPFTVRLYDKAATPLDSMQVPSGQSAHVPLNGSGVLVEIDGHGTVSDPSQLPLLLAENGRSLFLFYPSGW